MMATAQTQTFEPLLTFETESFMEQQPETPDVESEEGRDEQEQETNNKAEDNLQEYYNVVYKHPLEHIWTLWYLENDRTKHWKDMLNEITEIDSVETFWSLYYTIKTPAELKIGCDYSMFKRGIKPMWEDESNIKGGRWLITVNKNSKLVLDRLWLDILLMMVGHTFEYSSEICGAVVNIRAKSNKISVWTADGTNEAGVLEIGQKLKMLLHLQSQNLQYQLHSDAMVKINSGVKSVYTL